MTLENELKGYDGRAIANLILSSYDAATWQISNKKINKLIYFVHGFGLARLERKLVRNYFEAWDHGPVVRVVYDTFKRFGFSPIPNLATYTDLFDREEKVVEFHEIVEEEKQFILQVAGAYIKYTADELEAMTHSPGSPWHAVKNLNSLDRPYRLRIPDPLIREYFVRILGDKRVLN